MAKLDVLIEVKTPQPDAFGAFEAARASETESLDQAERVLSPLAGLGIELEGDAIPVPMFVGPDPAATVPEVFSDFRSTSTNPDLPAVTVVVPAQVESSDLEALRARPGVRVWPNSEITLFADWDPALHDVQEQPSDTVGVLETPTTLGGVDCRPFRPGVEIDTVRALLGRAQSSGTTAIAGRTSSSASSTRASTARCTRWPAGSRGRVRRSPGRPRSRAMARCAPPTFSSPRPTRSSTTIPFSEFPNSGGALAMFQAVLEQRRLDGTPHLTSNSYGFVGVPSQTDFPTHEVWDINHPVHRKVREVIASGAPAFFAAGNCGQNCPSGACRSDRHRARTVDSRLEQPGRGHHHRRGQQPPRAHRLLLAGPGHVRAARSRTSRPTRTSSPTSGLDDPAVTPRLRSTTARLPRPRSLRVSPRC